MRKNVHVTFQFEGDEKEIALLYGDIVNCVIGATKEHGEYYPWLGELLIDAGLGDKIYSVDYIFCLGQITYYDYDDNGKLIVEAESEVPTGKMWPAIFEKKGYKSIKFAYQATTQEGVIVETYNPHNIDNIFLNYSVDINVHIGNVYDCGVSEFFTAEQVCDFINERFGCHCKSYKESLEFVDHYDFEEGEYCKIEKIPMINELKY